MSKVIHVLHEGEEFTPCGRSIFKYDLHVNHGVTATCKKCLTIESESWNSPKEKTTSKMSITDYHNLIVGLLAAKYKTFTDRYIKSKTQREQIANARVSQALQDIEISVTALHNTFADSKVPLSEKIKVDYFANEKGDYTITLHGEPVAFAPDEASANKLKIFFAGMSMRIDVLHRTINRKYSNSIAIKIGKPSNVNCITCPECKGSGRACFACGGSGTILKTAPGVD